MADPQSAPVPRRARGRPKGTGIDDAILLGRITAALRADAALKPTTAIKHLGIADPSVIRRLRDKMRAATPRHTVPSADEPKTKRPSVSTVAPPTPQAIAPANDTPKAATPLQPSPLPKPLQPLESEQEKRTRNALLLATYLEALVKSAPQAPTEAAPALVSDPVPSMAPPPQAPANKPDQPAPEPQNPAPTPPFRFPGLPPFLQPFQQTPTAVVTSPTNQLEGMKLAVEAMTSMAKLQLHITENAMAYSPMALMLQGQTFVGQMLLASFSGQLGAQQKKPPEQE